LHAKEIPMRASVMMWLVKRFLQFLGERTLTGYRSAAHPESAAPAAPEPGNALCYNTLLCFELANVRQS
jgi:hypothetical protein